MGKSLNARARAASILLQIIDRGKSLDAALPASFEDSGSQDSDRGFTQELVYGVCRWYGELDALAQELLRKPIRTKDRDVHFALLVGLYQLRHLQTADHAAVSETVAACRQLGKPWAAKLLNGCLRNYLRQPPELTKIASRLSHPEWLIDRIERAWPEHSETILEANNQRPPMCLRVNRMQYSRDDYLELLQQADLHAEADAQSADGIVMLKAVPVSDLPGFFEGAVSVQDTAAQLACDILNAQKDDQVLDACAAPGGKAAHLLERHANQISLQALDISPLRCEQLRATFSRLNLQAAVDIADASKPPTWCVPKSGYQRILIDAPCSGTGVIRRHPDIRHHRRPSDIVELNKIQTALLSNQWELLAPNGYLLYLTCSILPSENQQQIAEFVASRNDAMLEPFVLPNSVSLEQGQQTLPGVHGMDGFYYCLLAKK